MENIKIVPLEYTEKYDPEETENIIFRLGSISNAAEHLSETVKVIIDKLKETGNVTEVTDICEYANTVWEHLEHLMYD